jgi:hypothetical protein
MTWTPCGDPDAIEDLAVVVDRQADELWWNGDQVRQRADASSWRAPRADRFRSDMQARQAEAHRLTAELHDIAIQLRALAQSVRGELSVLAGIERQVLHLISEFVPAAGLILPWEGTPWSPQHLPRTGDPAWRDVARAFDVC